MGTRMAGAETVYAAAAEWVERGLRSDDSLFTPGQAIWTSQGLRELRERFLNRPDESGQKFLDKLERQLAGAPAPVIQLMAEVLYVHFLIVYTRDSSTEEQQLRRVLSWSSDPISIPATLVEGLVPGLANPGQAFHAGRPFQAAVIIEFVEDWKQLSPFERERLLADPWAFKDYLLTLSPRSEMLREHGNRGRSQRQALLHLVHPDTFESIVSLNHKEMIASAFGGSLDGQSEDLDRRLATIRALMEDQYGVEAFHFYRRDIRQQWDSDYKPDRWDEYVASARAYLESGRLESDENDYKIEIGRRLSAAREAVQAGSQDWSRLVKSGISGNLIHNVQRSRFSSWVDGSPDEAYGALRAIWGDADVSATAGLQPFFNRLPGDVISGAGTRTTLASILLMGIDVLSYPPFQTSLFAESYARTGYEEPSAEATEVELYEHALGFLDRLIAESKERGLQLRHRLDAQSVVWAIRRGAEESAEQPASTPKDSLPLLAEQLCMPLAFLEEIELLLHDKRQVIFQGPPGTGKTYVAQELAQCLARSEARVTLVQFHPSYAYEDFVQGYRPVLHDGQQTFALMNGPLLHAAEQARAASSEKHFLVIDEINRGNLAKVFGELYFLLEYRDRGIRLQYADDAAPLFSLPDNLYVIGTMNTADRSIALVDLALRRRFHFVDFHPDEQPVKDLLRRWLGRNGLTEMMWVADVVDLANQKLSDDRHAAIGPSYFMKPNLDDGVVERNWKHSVRPYIEERLFGDEERLAEFDLDSLRSRVARPAGDVTDGERTASIEPDGD